MVACVETDILKAKEVDKLVVAVEVLAQSIPREIGLKRPHVADGGNGGPDGSVCVREVEVVGKLHDAGVIVSEVPGHHDEGDEVVPVLAGMREDRVEHPGCLSLQDRRAAPQGLVVAAMLGREGIHRHDVLAGAVPERVDGLAAC